MSGSQHTCFVSGISSATASSSVLRSSSATATISADWPERERGRAREKREKGREKSERRWILGSHSLAEVEVRTKISVEVILTAPFTDLSKGGDTTGRIAWQGH